MLMQITTQTELIAAAEGARIAGLSGEHFRQLTLAGEIPSIRIEPNGYRVYVRSDVEAFKQKRANSSKGRK